MVFTKCEAMFFHMWKLRFNLVLNLSCYFNGYDKFK